MAILKLNLKTEIGFKTQRPGAAEPQPKVEGRSFSNAPTERGGDSRDIVAPGGVRNS